MIEIRYFFAGMLCGLLPVIIGGWLATRSADYPEPCDPDQLDIEFDRCSECQKGCER